MVPVESTLFATGVFPLAGISRYAALSAFSAVTVKVIDSAAAEISEIVMLGAVASDLLGLGISPVVYVLLAAAAGLVIKQLEVKKP